MTLSAVVARWFGITLSRTGPASGLSPLAQEHYEEDDEYRRDGDDGSEYVPDGPSAEDEGETDGYFRPSKLFASSYEEEAVHRKDAELLLVVDELILSPRSGLRDSPQ